MSSSPWHRLTNLNKLEEWLMESDVYTKYGSPDVLQITDHEKSTPGDDEVLVRVHAVSINARTGTS